MFVGGRVKTGGASRRQWGTFAPRWARKGGGATVHHSYLNNGIRMQNGTQFM